MVRQTPPEASTRPLRALNPMRLDSPLKVTISYTHTCPLRCRHCYAGCTDVQDPRELSAAQWNTFIAQAIEDGVISILFEGGEPLHRADFLDVLRRASVRTLTRLRTHGTTITPELAAELKRIGTGTVLVDVMGATAATHDWFAGHDGAFDAACRAVPLLIDAGVPTQMLIIMTRRNVGELQAFLDLAVDLGVRTVGILRLYPIGRAKALWPSLSLTIDEMMAALGALRIPPGLKLMQSWHPNDGNCCWQMAAVNAHGDSIGCSYLREFVHYGNIVRQSLRETWDHPLYRELRSGTVEASCGDCASTQGSHGGCRATAYAFHGRWTAPDPFDITLNDGVDLRDLPEWMLQARPRPAA